MKPLIRAIADVYDAEESAIDTIFDSSFAVTSRHPELAKAFFTEMGINSRTKRAMIREFSELKRSLRIQKERVPGHVNRMLGIMQERTGITCDTRIAPKDIEVDLSPLKVAIRNLGDEPDAWDGEVLLALADIADALGDYTAKLRKDVALAEWGNRAAE